MVQALPPKTAFYAMKIPNMGRSPLEKHLPRQRKTGGCCGPLSLWTQATCQVTSHIAVWQMCMHPLRAAVGVSGKCACIFFVLHLGSVAGLHASSPCCQWGQWQMCMHLLRAAPGVSGKGACILFVLLLGSVARVHASSSCCTWGQCKNACILSMLPVGSVARVHVLFILLLGPVARVHASSSCCCWGQWQGCMHPLHAAVGVGGNGARPLHTALG